MRHGGLDGQFAVAVAHEQADDAVELSAAAALRVRILDLGPDLFGQILVRYVQRCVLLVAVLVYAVRFAFARAGGRSVLAGYSP